MGIWQASGFRLYTLTFTLMGSTSAKDAFGNPIPVPGASVTLKAYLKASTYRSAENPGTDLRAFRGLGMDMKTLEMRGRLDDPKEFPSGLAWGSTCPMTLNGVEGTFELRQPAPSPIQLVDDQLGAKVVGLWRAT